MLVIYLIRVRLVCFPNWTLLSLLKSYILYFQHVRLFRAVEDGSSIENIKNLYINFYDMKKY